MPTPFQYQIQVGSFCITGGGQFGIGSLISDRSLSKPPIGFNPPQSPPESDTTVPAASDNGQQESQSKGGAK